MTSFLASFLKAFTVCKSMIQIIFE